MDAKYTNELVKAYQERPKIQAAIKAAREAGHTGKKVFAVAKDTYQAQKRAEAPVRARVAPVRARPAAEPASGKPAPKPKKTK